MRYSLAVAMGVTCLMAQSSDLSTTVAAKHQQIQAAIAAGDLQKASTLGQELNRLISDEWGRQLPTPEQMLAKAEATESRASSMARSPDIHLYTLFLLPRFAIKAGDYAKAAHYAALTLQVASQAKKEGVYGDCIYEAYTVQGQVAVRDGDIAGAKQALLNSLSGASYSKNVTKRWNLRYELAQALLDRGERDAVVQFLEQCAALVPADRERYAVWIAAIKGGANPELNSRYWF